MSFGAGMAADYTPKKERLYAACMLFGLLANLSLARMSSRTDAWIFGLFYGCFTGAFNTAVMVVYAAHFGRLHLGAISGVATGLAQICGGMGPLLYSAVHRLSGSYTPVFYVFTAAMAVLFVLLCLPQRLPEFDRSGQHVPVGFREESEGLIGATEETSL
jgi:nitrate/nitrite transporter NarK